MVVIFLSAPFSGPAQSAPTNSWTLLLPHFYATSSPAIAPDGTLYIAEGQTLHAINSTNRLAPLMNSSWPMFRANPRHTGRVPGGN